MKSKLTKTLMLVLAAFAGSALAQSNVVTIYAADGLHDGNPSWFGNQFDAFTKATGIKIQYIEAGSSGVADRIAKEKSNTQADVLVTLPPFMQRAAADGLLQPYTPAGADKLAARDKDPKGLYVAMINNYPNFIYNSATLKDAPKTYEDLLDRSRQFGQEHMFLIGARILSGTVSAEQAGEAFARLALGQPHQLQARAAEVADHAVGAGLPGRDPDGRELRDCRAARPWP